MVVNTASTKKTFITAATSFVVLFSSCSGSTSESKTNSTIDSATAAPASVYDTSLAKGKVTDSVICRGRSNVSYALYLPSGYTPARQFPCIIFFDSHARGALPVRSYKDIAERYGFILAGSNVSKNGTPWNVTNDGVNAMMADIRSRINIDPRRIYTSGFSGGSRVASSVAIMDGGIAGVIGCAAGFPSLQQGLQNKFDYFGIVGDRDFNMGEMEQLDDALEQNGFAHQLLTSNGIHGWPTPADFQTAVLWMQVNAMKEGLQAKNDTIIAALKDDLSKRISAANKLADWIKVHELLSGTVRTLTGLSDVSAYKKQLDDLQQRAEFKDAAALQHQLQQKESQMQQELASRFTQQDEGWWAKKIAELNGNAKHAKTKQESLMYQRVINYLGLVGYMASSRAINTGDLTHAQTYLKVFKLADPENPDCDYLAAMYYVKAQEPVKAIASLKQAAELGYSDVAQLANEPVFSSLWNDAAFKSVANKVAENYRQR